MKVFEVTSPRSGGDVQYLPVVDKGPKTPEELAARNTERAASGQQAADIADFKARQASGLYAQKPKQTTQPAPVTPVATAPTTVAIPQAKPAPTPSSQYVVKPGDNLTKIAKRLGTTLPELLKANPQYKANPNLIHPGDKITSPGSASAAPVATAPTAPTAPTLPTAPTKPARDNFAQANAYLDQQSAAADQKVADTRARRAAAGQKSANANATVDAELAAMDKETAGINASTKSKYYVQPAKVGMNGEMDYVVVDRVKGLEVKSFNSQAEADAWIKQQPVAESLSRILQIAGLR